MQGHKSTLHFPAKCAKIVMVARPGRGCHLRRTDLLLLVSLAETQAERRDSMVTYTELFAFCTLLVAIIALVHEFDNRDK